MRMKKIMGGGGEDEQEDTISAMDGLGQRSVH